MPFAVEMYFDGESERRIRALTDRWAAGGGPAVVKESRPHVSLAVADEVGHEKMEALLARFAGRHPPFKITLSAVGFFAVDPLIAFLAPKVDHALLNLHAEFLGEFAEGASGIWEHYTPRSWIPHCTLASGLTPPQSTPMIAEVQRFGLPVVCTLTEIGLVRFRPVEYLLSATFSGPPPMPNPPTDQVPAAGAAPAGKSPGAAGPA